jgi:hypothetical protein
MYSMAIDPTAIRYNEERAASCMQWIPKGLDRNQVITPNHKYRYEE